MTELSNTFNFILKKKIKKVKQFQGKKEEIIDSISID